MQLIINDKRLTQDMFSPATPGSAAIDLYACIDEELAILPGETVKISAGFSMHVNNPLIAAQILPRSGLGNKGLVLGNGTGLIDSDYQGEIQVSLWNRSGVVIETGGDGSTSWNFSKDAEVFYIQPMTRIAQLFFVPIVKCTLEVVDSFAETTERGVGGFGSTGEIHLRG